MAVSCHTTASISYPHYRSGVRRTRLSCATKVFVGLKPQSPVSFGVAKSNSHFAFHTKLHNTIQSWTSGSKPTGGHVKRFFGTPMAFIKVPDQESMQWMDPWSALSCERIIFIGGYIEENLSYLILSTILHIDSSDSNDPFMFMINSLGGDVHPSLAIYDTMQSLKCPVGTRCVGVAANMAGLLLAAGDKGSRSALPSSRIWLQPVAGSAYGKVDDVCNEENEISRLTNYIFNQLATKIGCPVEKIYKDIWHSKSFSAQEALEYGLIDRIVRPPRLTTDPSIKGDRKLVN